MALDMADSAAVRRGEMHRDAADAAEYDAAMARAIAAALARVANCPRGCTCRGMERGNV